MTRGVVSWRNRGIAWSVGTLLTLGVGIGNVHAADPAPAKDAKPTKLFTKNGKTSMRVGLGVQTQLDNNWDDTSDGYEHGAVLRFRRIQPLLKGNLLSKKLTYKIMIEAIPSKIDIMDVFLNYKLPRKVQLRVGLQKVAFTRKRTNSWKNQSLVDFSLAPRYLGTERQAGFSVHNGIKKAPRHFYHVGIYSGMTARKGIGTGIARVSQVKRTAPTLMSDKATPWNEFHPSVFARYAFHLNGINPSTETDWKRSNEFRLMAGVAASYDFAPAVLRDFRHKNGVDLMAKWRGLTFFGTFWTGFYARKDKASSSRLGLYGGVVQLSYLYTKWGEVALRYALVKTTKTLRQDSQNNAQALADAGDGAAEAALSKPAKAGLIKSDAELAFGLNFFPFKKKNLKLATDFGVLMQNMVGKGKTTDLRQRFLVQYNF